MMDKTKLYDGSRNAGQMHPTDLVSFVPGYGYIGQCLVTLLGILLA